eukprot:TRINITY_DN4517_c0_g1_i10.p2 TRINITY_DN4517_c0_g1~~TRINITY_DN4517_c0_g1_i10.p2  ORF type:complete len:289 (-),score=50.58 TRINITY_DN4517_c0_g1_i10:173-1039(-)
MQFCTFVSFSMPLEINREEINEQIEEIEEIDVVGSSNYYGHHEAGDSGKCQCSWCQMMPSPSIPSPDFPSPECPSPPFLNDLDGGDEEFDIEQLKQLLIDCKIIDEQEAEELGQKANQREQEEVLKARVEMSLCGSFMQNMFHNEVVSVLGLQQKVSNAEEQERQLEINSNDLDQTHDQNLFNEIEYERELKINPIGANQILKRGELDLLSADFIKGRNQSFVVCFGHSRENDIILWSARTNCLRVMKDVCPVPVRSIKWCPASNWRFLVIASHDPILGGYLRIVDML